MAVTSAEYQLAWRAKNPEKQAGYSRTYKEGHRKELAEKSRARQRKYRDWMDGVKVWRGGCRECPEKDPACLDFHHRRPETKSFNIGATCNVARERVKAEMCKCDVLCANCHRKIYGRSV